mgnify:CR=1 FL=1
MPRCPITPHIEALVDLAIEEDLGRGDATTAAVSLGAVPGKGRILAKEPVVVCGLDLAMYVFGRVSPGLKLSPLVADGDEAPAGAELLVMTGPLAPMLEAERTALNFLQRMSGVATLTRRMTRLIEETGAKARLVDTRKTLPGWRLLDKHAVRCGGGGNHRFDLASGVLIKDNHIAAAGSVWEAVTRARRLAPHTLRVEVEVTSLAELEEALHAKAEVILLDNMDTGTMATAVGLVAGRALVEASGGVTEETLAAIARTGVDLISMGTLTHSARAVDLSMYVQRA